MPNCLVVQHVVPEAAFAIEDALRRSRVGVDARRVFAGDTIPADLSGLDGLVVMGGPMSAGSDEKFPTRPAEIELLAGAIETGVPTLGVCLGAQLLALAGGGSVSAGARGPEIGWDQVTTSAACGDDALFAGLPETLTVLQWHSDTFEIPPGASLLMSSPTYPNQAFRTGDRAWGVQFHLEVTQAAVAGFLRAFGADADVVPGGRAHIKKSTPDSLEALTAPRDLVFGRFAALVAARTSTADLVDPV